MTPLIATLMLCIFAVTTGEFVIAGILPFVAGDLSVSIPAAGMLVTAYALGMIFGGPVLTALTARVARRPLMIILLGIAIAGNVASALAPDYTSLFLARTATALVTSTFFANAIIVATSTAATNKKASTIAKLVFGMNIAMILGVPLGTWIGTHASWRATFAAIAGICALGLLLGLRYIPHVAGSTVKSPLEELRVLRERSVQFAIAITALGNAGILAVFTYFTPLMTSISHFTPEAVAILLLLYGVGATLGNLAGGWLADKSLRRSQTALLGVLAVSLLFVWFASDNQFLTSALVFVLGALSSSVIPGMQTRVLLAAVAAPTLAIAVNASAYQLSAALASWYGGVVIEQAGLQAIYIVAAVITGMGWVLTIFISRSRAVT